MLLDLLKVGVGDIVIVTLVAIVLAWVAALEAAAHVVRVEAVLRAALGATGVAVHLLGGLLPDGVHLVHGVVDAGYELS